MNNKIISGIWAGKNKSTSDILFQNLLKETNHIRNIGLIVDITTNRKKFLLLYMDL